MVKPLSEDLRERVVRAYLNKEGSAEEIGRRFMISGRSVGRYVKLYNTTGQFHAKPHTGGNIHKKVLAHHAEALVQWLREDTDLTNPELAALLAQHYAITIDPSQISRILKPFNITRKKKSPTTPRSTLPKSNASAVTGDRS